MIITMIFLVVVTVVCTAAIQGSIVDEHLVGATRDRSKAFQMAEGALRVCLARIVDNKYTGVALKPAVAPAPQNWNNAAVWDAAIEVFNDDTYVRAGVEKAPKCIFETIGVDSYRVTARAVGGTSSAYSLVQATSAPE